MKYVLVTGGVVSGLGKGVTASSIGVLLKACGHRVTSIKIGERPPRACPRAPPRRPLRRAALRARRPPPPAANCRRPLPVETQTFSPLLHLLLAAPLSATSALTILPPLLSPRPVLERRRGHDVAL
jgi:hypothetical protein